MLFPFRDDLKPTHAVPCFIGPRKPAYGLLKPRNRQRADVVDAPESLSRQLGKLVRQILRAGRGAGVAVNHAPILEQIYRTEKPKNFNGIRLFQMS